MVGPDPTFFPHANGPYTATHERPATTTPRATAMTTLRNAAFAVATTLALAGVSCTYDEECDSLADCPEDATACSNGRCQYGSDTVADAGDDNDDLGLGGCSTNSSCCPDQSDPFCELEPAHCRTETDCYMECGRCLVRGCDPPDEICRNADAGDADASDAADTSDAGASDADATDGDDTDALDCGADETRLDDACRRCGAAGGCGDTGPACRATCPDGTCDRSGFSCEDDVCRRVCY